MTLWPGIMFGCRGLFIGSGFLVGKRIFGLAIIARIKNFN
jgi:hypothetical protein